MKGMDIRGYAVSDRENCLAVFDTNMPEYFGQAARAEFEAFLDAPGGPYFVMDHEGAIVGCGGYTVSGPLARLTWGMIRRDLQRQGLGRFLLLYRMREMTRGTSGVEYAGLTATRHAAPFFESQGFRSVGMTDVGLVEMTKRLIVCA